MEKQSRVLEYRRKHPRCRYCLYKKNAGFAQFRYQKCVLKDVPLTEGIFGFGRWQGCFCKGFEPLCEDY